MFKDLLLLMLLTLLTTRKLDFEIRLKNVQRLTAVDAVDTVDIKKFGKNIFFSPVFCC